MKFAIYNDPSKTTSGQRFWSELSADLAQLPDHDAAQAKIVFFNISAPFRAIFKAKLRGRKIIMRLDGIYHEKLTAQAIDAIDSTMARGFLHLIAKIAGAGDLSSWSMNLISHNAKLLFKVWFADHLIYQSEFSRGLWHRYFPRKRSTVILNGAISRRPRREREPNPILRLVTTYDPWRPSKRLHDLIGFIRWHNRNSPRPVELLLLGYDHKVHPATLTQEDRDWLEAGREVGWLPPFKDYTPEIAARMLIQDIFITFSFRDNCPNVVVEAMSFGLPVVALHSGGIPQIVGDAGEIVPHSDEPGYFCSFDRSFDFPAFDAAAVSRALLKIADDYPNYRARVERRFATELELSQVIRKYLDVLKEA